MLLWEMFAVALQSIRANFFRALLTMLGIIIGVAAVIKRFSVIKRLQSRQVINLGFHAIGKCVHQLAAIAGVHVRPVAGLESMASRFGSRLHDRDETG